jgi:hypothetical protein
VDIVPVRQRDLEALAALVRDLLEPGLDGGSASDAGQAFALERDELGAERVPLLDQGVCRRRAAAGSGCHGASGHSPRGGTTTIATPIVFPGERTHATYFRIGWSSRQCCGAASLKERRHSLQGI